MRYYGHIMCHKGDIRALDAMKCPQHRVIPHVPPISGQGPWEMGTTLLHPLLADLLVVLDACGRGLLPSRARSGGSVNMTFSDCMQRQHKQQDLVYDASIPARAPAFRNRNHRGRVLRFANVALRTEMHTTEGLHLIRQFICLRLRSKLGGK